MSKTDDRSVEPMDEMARIAKENLNINSWGFQESYRSAKSKTLIFNSEFCRLNFVWEGWDSLGGNTISIYYGRLHAPSDKAKMLWNGEECRCWHEFDYALHFLDGRSPVDVIKLNSPHPIKVQFYEEEFRQKFRRRQPEWLAQMHATVWQHYGKRLFGLFDLGQPELWEQYRQFLKEFYDIKGRSPAIKPPLDKVC